MKKLTSLVTSSQIVFCIFYQQTWRTVDYEHEVLSRPAHARARFLTAHAHAGFLIRVLTSRVYTGKIRPASF